MCDAIAETVTEMCGVIVATVTATATSGATVIATATCGATVATVTVTAIIAAMAAMVTVETADASIAVSGMSGDRALSSGSMTDTTTVIVTGCGKEPWTPAAATGGRDTGSAVIGVEAHLQRDARMNIRAFASF